MEPHISHQKVKVFPKYISTFLNVSQKIEIAPKMFYLDGLLIPKKGKLRKLRKTEKVETRFNSQNTLWKNTRLEKYTLEKYTLKKYTLEKYNLRKLRKN